MKLLLNRNTTMARVWSFQIFSSQHLVIFLWKLSLMNVCQEKRSTFCMSMTTIYLWWQTDKIEVQPKTVLNFFSFNSYRAGEHALLFVRKSDDWGRMFSYSEWIPKLFPNYSEFNLLRDSAMKYHDCIKVLSQTPYKLYIPSIEGNTWFFQYDYIDYCWWATQNAWFRAWAPLLGYVLQKDRRWKEQWEIHTLLWVVSLADFKNTTTEIVILRQNSNS